jgi:hypothetical protein
VFLAFGHHSVTIEWQGNEQKITGLIQKSDLLIEQIMVKQENNQTIEK